MNKKKKHVRDKPVLVAFTEKEYETVRRHARQDQTSRKRNGAPNLSKFCRNIILKELGNGTDDRMEALIERFNYEIRKIGVNINQAVKKMNQGLGNETDIRVIKQKLEKLEELHKEVIEKIMQAGRR